MKTNYKIVSVCTLLGVGIVALGLFDAAYSNGSGLRSIKGTYAQIRDTPCNAANNGQTALTTSVYTARCNGVAWEWFFRGQPVTPPPTSGWLLDAEAGATATANADGTVGVYFPARAAVRLSAVYRAGAATQTVTTLVCAVYGNVIYASSDANTNPSTTSDAIGLRDSGGALAPFFWTINVGDTYYTSVDYWTSTILYSGTAFQYPNAGEGAATSAHLAKIISQDCHWLRIAQDVSNISWQYNYTGSPDNWVEYLSKPKGDFLTSGTLDPAIVGYTNRVGIRITIVSYDSQ